MSLVRHVLFWIGLALIELVLVCVFEGRDTILERTEIEMSQFGQIVDASTLLETAATAAAWTHVVMAPMGSIGRAKEPRTDVDVKLSEIGTSLGNSSRGFVRAMEAAIMRWSWRIQIAAKLCVPALCVLLAAAIDGLVRRRVKQYTYGYTNPVIFNIVSHAVIMLWAFPLIYLLSPLPVTVAWLAIWIAALALSLWWGASNLQGTL